VAPGHSVSIQTARHYERSVQSDESLQYGKSITTLMPSYPHSNRFNVLSFCFLAMEILQFEHLQFESAQTSRTRSVHQNRLAIVSSRSEKLFARLSQLRRDARRGQENARQQQQGHHASQCHGVFRAVRRFDRFTRSIRPCLYSDYIRNCIRERYVFFSSDFNHLQMKRIECGFHFDHFSFLFILLFLYLIYLFFVGKKN